MSLTEVVVAAALATIVVGGIMGVITQTATLGQGVDYTYVASNLAKNRIERIREIRKDSGYSALAETAETDTVIDRNGSPDANGDFVRSTVVNTAYATNLTRVTVKVKYKKKGVLIPADIELTTLLSPYT
jgi:Tfp pilus assembly protein PilV